MEGTVKFFNRKKGFGFVSGDDGKDYFVHFTNVAEGTFLRDNDRVSFDSAEGERGLKAENVQLLQKGSERTDLPEEGEEAPAEEAEQQEEATEEETPAEEPAQEEETPSEEPADESEKEPASEPAEEPTEEPAQEEAPSEEPAEETPAEETEEKQK